MGHPLILQALSPGRRLFARLASDEKVGTLFAQLFNCGGGPYTWPGLPDLDEILSDFAGTGPFASRADVDRAMADLLADLEEARAEHPGLESRRAYLDKTQWDIKERLAAELRRRGRGDADGLVEAMLFGAGRLTPPGVEGPMGDGLRVVPAADVQEAARVLGAVAPEALFDPSREDWLCADYRAFRELYLAAAEWGEAVIVGD
jgi:hypothetical protein